uniref:chorismate-binding protein n=1 Tax=Candidatus Planktophila sp. TaxID=2175601 RepID=UPI00404B4748
MSSSKNAPVFWMNGRLATGLSQVSNDPSSLEDGGFWAVSSTFEGAFQAFKFDHVVESNFPTSPWQKIEGQWSSSLNESEYVGYVKKVQEHIAQGWVYQVNACREISIDVEAQDLRGLFSKILEGNPAPWASYLEAPGINIASASPELFLKRKGKRIRTSPIKGTAPVGTVDFGVKDKAENVMIVDLMRNDLGQICKSGSVTVPRLLSTEAHPGLVHLVSDIEGELKDESTWTEIFARLSPPGSISGAPKSSAVSVIKENEGKRGPYCGALGWVQGDMCELSVAIRIFFKDDKLRFGTGAGITWASMANDEWEETQLKARRLVSLAGGVL